MAGRKYDPRKAQGYAKGGSIRDGVGGSRTSGGGGGPDSGRVGNTGMGAYGAVGKARGRRGQRDVTAGRSGGPEGAARLNRLEEEEKLPGIPAAAPEISALREAADLQNYFSDLQRIALGGIEAQEALARFGIAPEQSQFNYRSSFPEFGDLSGTPGGLPGIIRELGLMSRTPEKLAEGGRAGESFNRPGQSEVQTDVAKFGNMLRDLMLIEDKPTERQAERLEMAREAGAISPAMAMREGAQFQPGGLMPRGVNPPMPEGIEDRLGNNEPRETGSPRYGSADAFRFEKPRNNQPRNIIPEVSISEIEVEALPPPSEAVRFEEPEQTPDPERLDKMGVAFRILISQGVAPVEAQRQVRNMDDDELDLFEDILEETGMKDGGSVRGRTDALPLVEGDHVVPAHAVKGNEGGLASLSKKLTGNRNYDGMIRGPGGPRDDAINTRVYAGGGGIAGKMDNLQNPFNSVPARVSNKEYVIPRDAITNLGLMTGARQGNANKAGQDIIYELVESLKRKK